MNFVIPSAFHRYFPAAWLRITGTDAANFLQGQFTNDLRGLATGEVGKCVYGLWLNQKGKVLADSFVLRGGEADTFWVLSYDSPAALIRERLEAYVIADDVVIDDLTGDWEGIAFEGNVAEVRAWLGSAATGGYGFAGRRGAAEHAEFVYPRSAAAVVTERIQNLRALSAEEVARRRIAAAIPAVPADIGPGDLPNEGALEDSAISYTKGCYLGQEVMARLKSMGQVRRRLLRVRGEGAMPAIGAALWQGERQVGTLRSAVAAEGGFIGLAMLSLVTLRREAGLGLAPEAAPTVTVTDTMNTM